MSQQFVNQLEQVCRRRRRRNWLAASCWALAALLVAALLLMGLDRVLGVADFAGRAVLTMLLVTCGLLILRRGSNAIQKNRQTPLQVAYEVEQQHPALRDVLSSAWEFTQQSDEDPTAGSGSLRRAIVLRAAAAVEEIDWPQLIPRKPLRRAVLTLAGAGLVLSAFVWFFPHSVQIGFTRLLNPLSRAEWPREHDLQFVESPAMLAAGEDLVLQLRDTRGPLPAAITMHYRVYHQGHWQTERQLLTTIVDSTKGTLKIRWPNVQESLQFRATGADHQTMPWQPLEVIAPPRVEKFQLIVQPPAYTGLPARTWDKTTVIYAGSHLELQGQLDQPVAEVTLVAASGERLETQVAPDGLSFRVEPIDWRIEQSEVFSIETVTPVGLKSQATKWLTLEVVADQPPQVRIVEPLEDLTVLPNVVIPLAVEASDELAVREIELVFQRSDRPGESDQRLLLWETSGNDFQKHRVEYRWDLQLLDLSPGCVISVDAVARDAQPAAGRSVRTWQLKIVSEDELWQQLMDQQRQVGETLTQLLREQRALRRMSADWAELPAWSASRWASASHTALFRQRKISDALAAGRHSVLGQLAEIRQTIELNRLLRPAVVERLQAAQGLLQSLVDGSLDRAEKSLSELARQVRRSTDKEKMLPWVNSTAEHQAESVGGLKSAVELIMPGNVLARLERELGAMESDQKRLAEYCRTEVAPLVLRAEGEDSDVQAALANATRQQRALARRFAEWVLEMTQSSGQVADDEWGTAARLAETVALAEELGMQTTMQSTVAQLLQRRLGRVTALQQQALVDFAKLCARLAGKDAAGIAKRFEDLQTTERQLERLRRKLAAHERELHKLTAKQRQRELARLQRERKQLAEQVAALVRKLEHLRLPKAAQAVKQAASELRRAKLDTESTKQARKKLDTAQRELTTARRRQQVALARLEMAKLDAKLNTLVEREKTIQQEVLRLDEIRQQAGQLNLGQTESVQQLVVRQTELREETFAQGEQLTTLPVFAHLLKKASETMKLVEENLHQAELGSPTQTLVELTLAQLAQLAGAVRQQQNDLAGNNADDPPQEGGAGQGKNQGDTAQGQTLQLALGQLQLLKALQVALQEKTLTWEAQQAANQPTNHTSQELAQQQRQLTELAKELVPEPLDPPVEDLIPDLEDELERSFDELLLPADKEENEP